MSAASPQIGPLNPLPVSASSSSTNMTSTRKPRKSTHVYSLDVLPNGSFNLLEAVSSLLVAPPAPVVSNGEISPSNSKPLYTTHLNMHTSTLTSDFVLNRPTYIVPRSREPRNIYIHKPTWAEIDLEKKRQKRRIEELQLAKENELAAAPPKKRRTQIPTQDGSLAPKDQAASPSADTRATTPSKRHSKKKASTTSRKSKVANTNATTPASSPAPTSPFGTSSVLPPSTAAHVPLRRPRRKILPMPTERPSTRGMTRSKVSSTQADDASGVAVTRASAQNENGNVGAVSSAEIVDTSAPPHPPSKNDLPEQPEREATDRETVYTTSGGSTPSDITLSPSIKFGDLEIVVVDQPDLILTKTTDVIVKDETSILDEATNRTEDSATDNSKKRKMSEEGDASLKDGSPPRELRRSGRVSKKKKVMH